jgi:hypothetical protein
MTGKEKIQCHSQAIDHEMQSDSLNAILLTSYWSWSDETAMQSQRCSVAHLLLVKIE